MFSAPVGIQRSRSGAVDDSDVVQRNNRRFRADELLPVSGLALSDGGNGADGNEDRDKYSHLLVTGRSFIDVGDDGHGAFAIGERDLC